jgi:hypothetical protein
MKRHRDHTVTRRLRTYAPSALAIVGAFWSVSASSTVPREPSAPVAVERIRVGDTSMESGAEAGLAHEGTDVMSLLEPGPLADSPAASAMSIALLLYGLLLVAFAIGRALEQREEPFDHRDLLLLLDGILFGTVAILYV